MLNEHRKELKFICSDLDFAYIQNRIKTIMNYDSDGYDFPYVDLIYSENATDTETVQTFIQEYITAVEDVSSDQ